MRQLDHGITLLKWAIIGFDILIFVVYLFFADKVFAPSVPMMAGRNSLFLLYIGLISILSAEFLSTPVVYSFSATPSMIILRTMKLCSVQWLVFFILLWTGSLWLHPLLGSVIFSVGFLIMLLLVRMAEYGLIHSRIASSRSAGKSVIVGDASVMPILLDILRKQSYSRYFIEGYYSDSDFPDAPEWLRKKGDVAGFLQKIGTDRDPEEYDNVFCTFPWEMDKEIKEVLNYCDNTATRFFLLSPDAYRPIFNLKPEVLGESMVYTNHDYPLDRLPNKIVKRLFDLAVSGVACLVLLPFIPIIALIIKMQSPGPVFFRQERTGIDGKPFLMIKFRSMHVNKDADKVQATKDDPRKFPFGNFMRAANIDELPQFFNVLRGGHEHRGASSAHADAYGDVWSADRQVHDPAFREAWDHGLGSGDRFEGGDEGALADGGAGAEGLLVHQALVVRTGSSYHHHDFPAVFQA